MLSAAIKKLRLANTPLVKHTRAFSDRNYADQGKSFESSMQKTINKQQYLEKELKENPEFFKAFPHLQPPLYKLQNPEITEATKGKAVEYNEYRNKEFFD